MPPRPRTTTELQGAAITRDAQSLRRLVSENIDSVRFQMARAEEIVQQSREIVARVKLSLAHAQRIHDEMAGPGNPPIHRDRE